MFTSPDQWPWKCPPQGVYFNMAHETYLDIPAMSNGGIKDLSVDPANYWSNSHMNPFRVRSEGKHFVDGTAYHHRILFGKKRFYTDYAPAFVAPEGAIDGNGAMIEALQRIGVKGLSGKNSASLALEMKRHLPQIKTAIGLKADYEEEHAGKIFLSEGLLREIELGAKAIECNPHVNHWLQGGYPEVTVIWWDARLGVMCKCRFDYLKIGAAADLKTIANEKGRAFDKAVDYAIAGNKYFIQSSWYLPGAQAARRLIADGKYSGHLTGDAYKAWSTVDEGWLRDFAATPVTEFRFIFQQKKMSLVTAGRIHSLDNRPLVEQGQRRIEHAITNFHRYMKEFGPDKIWFSISPPQHIDVTSLPAFAGDL